MAERNTTIYAVEFQGGDAVISGFKNVSDKAGASAGAAAAKTTSWQESLKKTGNAAGEVSGKLGQLAGAASGSMGQAAGAALSFASALGEGGVLGVFALATAAVGAFQAALEAAERAEQVVAETAKRYADDERKFREDNLALLSRKRTALSAELVETERIAVKDSETYIQRLQSQLDYNRQTRALSAQELRDRGIDIDKVREMGEAAKDLELRIHAETGQLKRKQDDYYRDRKTLTAREANEANAAAAQEGADRIRTIEKAAAQDAERRDKEFTDKRIAAYWSAWEKRKRADREGVGAMVGALDLAANADAEFNAEFAKGFVTWEQHTAAVEKEADAERKRADEVAKAEEADRRHREQLQAKSDAVDANTKAMLYSASVNTGYEASMYLVGNATSFATNELRKFGDINRDNYREMLEFGPKARDALVARAQAAIFAMGLEAGTKSIFETGEAIRETAMGFGMLAIPGMQGNAAVHFVSAATHMAAASAYATIGGGAVAGSLAVGATRGKGGLFGTGADAVAGAAGGTATPSGQGSSAGPTSGTSNGRTQSAGPVVVNFIYEAGSMNAGDTQRLGRGVARGVRAANRDGFARRQMR